VSKYGLIYAGAQKNLAPAGLTFAIIKEELAGNEMPFTPSVMSYKNMIEKDSMYNTPSTWPIYILGLMCDWVESVGGTAGIEQMNIKKANLLYEVLEDSKLFQLAADKDSRSFMNVTFRTGNDELDAKFASEAGKKGFSNLKGHRSVGGMRASIYNAMPMEGVEALCDFIREFEKTNG
jgi:phosphoserine aminotransferase